MRNGVEKPTKKETLSKRERKILRRKLGTKKMGERVVSNEPVITYIKKRK